MDRKANISVIAPAREEGPASLRSASCQPNQLPKMQAPWGSRIHINRNLGKTLQESSSWRHLQSPQRARPLLPTRRCSLFSVASGQLRAGSLILMLIISCICFPLPLTKHFQIHHLSRSSAPAWRSAGQWLPASFIEEGTQILGEKGSLQGHTAAGSGGSLEHSLGVLITPNTGQHLTTLSCCN